MKTIILALLPLFAWAAFAACRSAKNQANLDTKLVELRTSGCRGYCPRFRLTFWNNGKAEFEGIQFTAQTGLKNFDLSKAELAELQALVKKTNLWQYPDRIESTVMDAPGATLTVFEGEKSKSVLGTIDRPKPLLELESRLKSLAESKGIQVVRGVDPNEPKPGERSELLVTLKPDVNAGNWIVKFEEIRLRLVRRIPPANTWLVAYDKKQVEEKALIELFKSTEGVLDAKPNLKADERN